MLRHFRGGLSSDWRGLQLCGLRQHSDPARKSSGVTNVIDSTQPTDLFESSPAIEALQALEKNTRAAIMHERGNDRMDIEIKVTVAPGNASERSRVSWAGVTGNVSPTGCLLVTSAPLVPGDIYYVSFDDDNTNLPHAIGRCIRSRFIREGAFEAGVRFFSEINLADAV